MIVEKREDSQVKLKGRCKEKLSKFQKSRTIENGFIELKENSINLI